MAALVHADSIRIPGACTLRFEGRDHGSGASFYLVVNEPGTGPGLHRHPYTETWHVVEGEATITIGDEKVVARPGDTAVVLSGTWHAFVATGPTTLRMVCIHASPDMIQENR